MIGRDVIFACAALAVATAYYLAAAAIPPSLLDDGIGPAGVPKMYAAVLATLSMALLAGRVARRRRPAAVAAPGVQLSWRAGATLFVGVAYVVAVAFIGYVAALALLMAATVRWFGGGFDRRTIAIAAGGAVAFWIFFVLLLRIPQPAGLWNSLF